MKPGISSAGTGGGWRSKPTKALSTFGGGRKLPGRTRPRMPRLGAGLDQEAEGAVGLVARRATRRSATSFWTRKAAAGSARGAAGGLRGWRSRRCRGDCRPPGSARGRRSQAISRASPTTRARAGDRQAAAQDGGPVGVELPAEHPGSGGEQLGGQHAAAGADLQHPLPRRRQEVDQRPAEGAVDQVVLAQGLLQERRRTGEPYQTMSTPTCQFGPCSRPSRGRSDVRRIRVLPQGNRGAHVRGTSACSLGIAAESMELDVATLNRDVERETLTLKRVEAELRKVIVGQDYLLDRLLVGLLARGHVLIEGVPGLAKTLAVKTLAQTLAIDSQRIQFTPDLLPADLVGTLIYDQRSGDFLPAQGPGVHPSAARRRDQPRPRQGAVGAARIHGGAAGHARRPELQACPSRSWCWPPRTRSSRRGPTRSPRRRWTAS